MEFAPDKRYLPLCCDLIADSVNGFQSWLRSFPKVNIFNGPANLYEAAACGRVLPRATSGFNQREQFAESGIPAKVECLYTIDVSVISTVWLDTAREIVNINIVE